MGVLGSFGILRPFLGTMITGDAYVHCIMPASSSLLMVLSAQGLNFSGIVYGADMQGGPFCWKFYRWVGGMYRCHIGLY